MSFSVLIIFGQSFQKITYSVNEGLVTHLTKSVEFDSIGFLWIGTDEGLVRYDGRNFKTFQNKTQSRYVKKLINHEDNIWVINDLGIVRIKPGIDSVVFENVIDGAREPTDSLLHYPKDAYSDKEGRKWISEPDKLVRLLADGSVKKYHFNKKDQSSSFFRSFQVFEYNNELYVISYHGYVYRYENEEFQELEYNLEKPLSHVYTVVINQNKILVGDRNGIHRLDVDKQSVQSDYYERLDIKEISNIQMYDDKSLVAGDFNGSLYLIDLEKQVILNKERIHKVNDVEISEDGNIWVASDEGLILFRRNYFNRLSEDEYYVESINVTGQSIYYCFKEELHKIVSTPNGYEQKLITRNDDEYFLSITGREDNLWLSNRDKVIHLKNDKVVETISFQERGYFIFDLLLDFQGRLWVNQDNINGPLVIMPDGSRIDYSGISVDARIMVMKEAANGDIYFGTVGAQSYIFKYSNKNDNFTNLSLPLPEDVHTDFEVNDLWVANDTIWLATSQGLFRQVADQIKRIELEGGLTILPVKAVTKANSIIWFSNTYGVLAYNIITSEFVVFNESSGLTSRSGNGKALKIDNQGTIWVGSARGLSYAIDDQLFTFKTKKPIITKGLYNDKVLTPESFSSTVFESGSYLKLNFVSLNLPGDAIEYQYKSNDDEWKNLGNSNFIEITGAQSGKYQYKIRAKHQGNYSWSEPAIITFEVDIPIYIQPWFIGMSLILILIIGFVVYKYNRIRLANLEDRLNRIVNEKTLQLQLTNEELIHINKELDMFVYSASHDMKAPLSSLLGLLNIYNHETSEEKKQDLLNMMRDSIYKLDAFLKEIIDYSKNSRLGVEKEKFDFKGLIHELLESFKYMEDFNKVKIELKCDLQSIISDKNRLRIILNNLISNSIRYYDPTKKDSWINICLKKKGQMYELIVADNGIGIDKVYQSKIFEMFFRANESKTGSGLGLYIVKEAVRNLNGEIELDSKVNEGSRFTITFPE